jgi:D-alanyl-D-alanine carboxypeptidase/D-alanyl-D-alanine-endopeptidase (penicillin-binding protein 4)
VADSIAPVPFKLDTLFVYVSPPLRAILPVLMKPSQNQVAELVFRTIGLERGGLGTADSAEAVIRRQLITWGAEPDGFAIYDGSGLSRRDMLTPETIVRVLDRMQRDTAFAVFYNSMPVAGVDGTLKSRMKGAPTEGNVRAKTGTLGSVTSLSGYVTSADGERLIFSILSNNWTTTTKAVRDVIDQIAAALAALRTN